jgi:hypothetical protein
MSDNIPREQSIKIITEELLTEWKAVDTAFRLLDQCVQRFAIAPSESTFASFVLVILVKAKHFAHACRILALEGFAQEAGAILRIWVEAIELVRYLAEQPERIQEIVDGRLPNAGERAKRIGGKFQRLRNYLNENSSHFSFTLASMSHVVNLVTRQIFTEPPVSINSLRANISVLFAFVFFTGAEAVNALGVADIQNEDLATLLAEIRSVGIQVFRIETGG